MGRKLTYLASGGPEIELACKECSRAVGRATRADLTRLRRIERYLLLAPRAVWNFPLSGEDDVPRHDHPRQDTLGTWSSTQKVVSLSSAEAAYHSTVRCASEALGMAKTIRELRHKGQVRVWTDAAAAHGLALGGRSGAAGHNDTKYLWLRQKKKNEELRMEKIRGNIKPHRNDDPSGWEAPDVVQIADQAHQGTARFTTPDPGQ